MAKPKPVRTTDPVFDLPAETPEVPTTEAEAIADASVWESPDPVAPEALEPNPIESTSPETPEPPVAVTSAPATEAPVELTASQKHQRRLDTLAGRV